MLGAPESVKNMDPQVVADFGAEWSTYDQTDLGDAATKSAFDQYFHIFPFDKIDQTSEGFDMGCGSGRWAKLIAPRVGKLHCIDPSAQALDVARTKMSDINQAVFHEDSVDGVSLEENSQDFGYCLGVLHHIPDTLSGIKDCTKLLKPGAPFLLYLYYDFENRPFWFSACWKAADFFRSYISKLPFKKKKFVCLVIAIIVYWPLARLAFLAHKLGLNTKNFLLDDYKDKPFYFLRTDALDRFGTRLEKRFSRSKITEMLEESGMENVSFSDGTPHWVSISYKK